MSKKIYIQVTAGLNTGPFNLYAVTTGNVVSTTPFATNVLRTDLVAGQFYDNLPDTIEKVRVVSKGELCSDIQTTITIASGGSNPVETTTQPQVLHSICLGYSATGGCAAACSNTCSTYYVYTDCYNYMLANDAANILDCRIYLNSTGTQLAPNGFYSRGQGLCYILGSSGSNEITGVTSCP